MITNRSIVLFNKAAKEIPGYRDFLATHNFHHAEVNHLEDFLKIPITSKKDYLQKYAQKDMFWEQDWNKPLSYSSTSGSTGEPYYFPRTEELALQGSYMIEDFIRSSSYGQGRTLVIIGFGMGVWIGGVITLRQFEIAAERMSAPISILPTGYNKKEVFKALQKLSPDFDQTIIVGYPPFMKEIVDEAESEGINLSNLHIRVLFAAEAFTETFRDYICRKAGINNPLLDTLNVYGTADVGAIAHETPLSILVRRLALDKPMLYMDLFGQLEKTPTLAQYNPEFIEFETVDGEVIITADAALPLIRYAIGDNGGSLGYDQVDSLLRHHGINLAEEIQKSGIDQHVNRNPFVFVYERKNMSVTLHGINIYPEFIKEGLFKRDLPKLFTERFTMATKLDIHHNQFVLINLELQQGIDPDDKITEKALDAIHQSLIEKSSEFAEISVNNDTKQLLRVVLWPNGHEKYFRPGVKQKWAESN